MNFFGYQIDLLLLIQLLITAIVITFYATLTSSKEAQAVTLSRRHMLLLINFLITHHPKVKSLQDLAVAEEKDIENHDNQIYWISRGLSKLQESGELPDIKTMAFTGFFTHLLLIVIAPFYAFWSVITEIQENKCYKAYLIIHTELRKNYFSKVMVSLFANLLFFAVALLLIFPRHQFWGIIILVISVCAIAASLVEVSAYVWWQMSWKDYWQDKLLDVMASGEKENNHDLFNRAMILKGYVEAQPDIPIPGNLGFYAVIFTAVQGILLWISKYLTH